MGAVRVPARQGCLKTEQVTIHKTFKIVLATHSSQDMEATSVSTDRWMDKEVVVHTYHGIFSHEKEWNNTICGSVDGPRDDHTKLKQVKKRQISYRLYVESKKKKDTGNCLVVQWLGLCAFTAEALGSFPGQETRILQVVCSRGENKGKKKFKWYKWIYLRNKNKLTDIENKLIVTKGDERDKLEA